MCIRDRYKIDFDRLNKVLNFVRKIDIEQTDVNDIIMEVIGGMNLNDYNLRGNKILRTARIIKMCIRDRRY